MRISVITIFPGYLDPLRESLLGKAIAEHVVELSVHDLRSWTTDRHRTVDDSPYGGGPGMVMKPDVWGRALDEIDTPLEPQPPTLVVPTPAGRSFVHPVHGDGAGRDRPSDLRLRPVRGHRPAGDHRRGHPHAGPRAVHRGLRAGRR